MLGALIYLRFTSSRNWLLSRARRLRQPKYLIGAFVGIGYFYFFFFRPMGRPPGDRVAGRAAATDAMELANAALPLDWVPVMNALGALALLVFTMLMWVVPTRRAALGFSEAEIAFLFPAPITRRGLVHFRLLSAQFRSLLGATVMMLFSNRWSALGGNPLTHAIGWWFIFSTLNLHFSGASFTLTRLADLGLGVWRRRIFVLIAIGAVVGISIARLPAGAQLPAAGGEFDLRPFIAWVIELTDTTPLSWLLWPLKCVLAPFLAAASGDFLSALLPALAVVTLHYLWVVRTAVAFEDATIDDARKRGARIAAWRAGDRRIGAAPTKGRAGPFALPSIGRPELAFLWKNLLSAWPYFTPRVFLGCAGVIVVACVWLTSEPIGRSLLPGAGVLAVIFAAYTLVVGPQFARHDIRSDLTNADVLKTYPLAGWQIILGEILTPVAILTGVLWLALLVVALTFQPITVGLPWLTPQLRIAGTVALAVVAPALVTLQLLVPNAAALFFPGWFRMARTRGGGPEVIGQRMIFFFAQVVAMALALVPATGAAALLIFIVQGWLGPVVAIGIAAFVVLVVLVAEAWCGIWLLGARFDKLDLSEELRS